jgi:hypothetical protein
MAREKPKKKKNIGNCNVLCLCVLFSDLKYKHRVTLYNRLT